MSYRQLTHIETNLLAKDLNLTINSKKLLNKDIIAITEGAKREADTNRIKIGLTFQNSKAPKDNFSKDQCKA